MTREDCNVLTCRSLFANNVNVDIACLYLHEKIHIRCEQRSGAPRNEETSQFGPLPGKDTIRYFKTQFHLGILIKKHTKK